MRLSALIMTVSVCALSACGAQGAKRRATHAPHPTGDQVRCVTSDGEASPARFKLRLTWPQGRPSREEVQREIAQQLNAHLAAPCAAPRVASPSSVSHLSGREATQLERSRARENKEALWSQEPREIRVALVSALGAHYSILTQPKTEIYQLNNRRYDVPYPTLSGGGLHTGLSLEGAWRTFSMSIGYGISYDEAVGYVQMADRRELSISQEATHIPITLRAELMNHHALKPSVFVGVDFVSTSTSRLKESVYFGINELDQTGVSQDGGYVGTRAGDYRSIMVGVGVDALLTARLRLPIRLYATFNPAQRDTLNDVITSSAEQEELESDSALGSLLIKSEWTWQLGLSVGFSFDIYQR